MKLLQEIRFSCSLRTPSSVMTARHSEDLYGPLQFVFAFCGDYTAYIHYFLFVPKMLRCFSPLHCPSTQEVQVEY